MLELRSLTKSFGNAGAFDVDLDVQAGEIVALLGASGSGKTTILNLVAGVLVPERGSVRIDGTDVARLPLQRRRLGYVFQDFALWPHLTVAEHVRIVSGRPELPLLERLGLGPLAARRPAELSGGQRQRVALARALAARPAIVLLDEPYSALDPVLREDLRVEVAQLLRERGVGALHVTHDPDEALTVADRIAVMDAGRIVQFGKAEDVYREPVSIAAARAFGRVVLLPVTCTRGCADVGGASWPLRNPAVTGAAMLAIRYDELAPSITAEGAQGTVVARFATREANLVRLRLPQGDVVVEADAPVGAALRVVPRGPVAAFPDGMVESPDIVSEA